MSRVMKKLLILFFLDLSRFWFSRSLCSLFGWMTSQLHCWGCSGTGVLFSTEFRSPSWPSRSKAGLVGELWDAWPGGQTWRTSFRKRCIWNLERDVLEMGLTEMSSIKVAFDRHYVNSPYDKSSPDKSSLTTGPLDNSSPLVTPHRGGGGRGIEGHIEHSSR